MEMEKKKPFGVFRGKKPKPVNCARPLLTSKREMNFFFFLGSYQKEKHIPNLWLSGKIEKLGYSFQEMILGTN